MARLIVHPADESAAKELFVLLHKESEALIAREISEWAARNGWRQCDAEELRALAARIGAGGRVIVKNKNCWRDDIVKQLKERAIRQ
ncbi:DUF1889 family protein [Azohydromonas aeria]|uniref:DUF1889 family protein n=1 Tax=Azohydromonas aeria TaxID=2590212 RepID=UPI0035BF9DC5